MRAPGKFSGVCRACYDGYMRLTIELDREVDGRWIAEIPELNVLLYGSSREEAIHRAEHTAIELIADKISQGELPPDSANPVFAVAA